jgi:hypothetical protein
MATAHEHETQATHNQTFLESIDSQRFPDWYATVAFYQAVHLVEKLFRVKGGKTGNHRTRNYTLKTKYLSVWRDYKTLYSFSRLARYRCMKVKKDQVAFIKQRLERVQRTIDKLVRTS